MFTSSSMADVPMWAAPLVLLVGYVSIIVKYLVELGRPVEPQAHGNSCATSRDLVIGKRPVAGRRSSRKGRGGSRQERRR